MNLVQVLDCHVGLREWNTRKGKKWPVSRRKNEKAKIPLGDCLAILSDDPFYGFDLSHRSIPAQYKQKMQIYGKNFLTLRAVVSIFT